MEISVKSYIFIRFSTIIFSAGGNIAVENVRSCMENNDNYKEAVLLRKLAYR